jgi:hypothetical protein
MDAEPAGLISGAVATTTRWVGSPWPPDNHRLAPQLGAHGDFHRGEELVEIHKKHPVPRRHVSAAAVEP